MDRNQLYFLILEKTFEKRTTKEEKAKGAVPVTVAVSPAGSGFVSLTDNYYLSGVYFISRG